MSSSPPIRPAATVVVLRDSAGGIEAFLVRRHHAVAFMAGAHVFPGGRVDDHDYCADESWCDGIAEARTKLAGVDADAALAFQVAAARELFEEAGVLLARQTNGRYVSLTAPADRDRFTGHRGDLNAGRKSLREIVEAERLRLSLDALVPLAHWVTPPIDIRRFDTRFFVARVPPDQAPVHDDHEATESCWIRPLEAIAAVGRGEISLPPPTWATLREIERFSSVAEAISWARTRPIYRREPNVIPLENGARRLLLPGDPSMPEPEPVAFETRFILTDGRWQPDLVR